MSDKERHLQIARMTGAWHSWVFGPWFTNGMMALRTPEPFSKDAELDIECSCTDQEHPDAAHRSSNDLPCAFIDRYGRPINDIRRLLLRTIAEYQQQPPLGHRIEGDRRPDPHSGLDTFRMFYPDGSWAGYQARYVDAINAVARPDRWELRRSPKIGHEIADLLIALCDGEIVGSIMPMQLEGSRIPPASVPSSGWPLRDSMPTPLRSAS